MGYFKVGDKIKVNGGHDFSIPHLIGLTGQIVYTDRDSEHTKQVLYVVALDEGGKIPFYAAEIEKLVWWWKV